MRDAGRGDGSGFLCKSGTLTDVGQLRTIGLGAAGLGAGQGGDRRSLGGDLAGTPLRGWPQRLGHAFQLAHNLTKSARQSSLSAPRPEARQQPCNLPQEGQPINSQWFRHTGSQLCASAMRTGMRILHITNWPYTKKTCDDYSLQQQHKGRGYVCSLQGASASSTSVQSKQMLCPAPRHTHVGRFEGFSSQQASISPL